MEPNKNKRKNESTVFSATAILYDSLLYVQMLHFSRQNLNQNQPEGGLIRSVLNQGNNTWNH